MEHANDSGAQWRVTCKPSWRLQNCRCRTGGIPLEILNGCLIATPATRRTERITMVQIHRNRAFLRRRATDWLPSVPEVATATSQALTAIRPMHLPRKKPAGTHVP
eukprot:2968531-Pleurochrysis_carterae.AAC.1